MRLVLETTYVQVIDLDDADGDAMVRDWENGDESPVVTRFDDIAHEGYQQRLWQEYDR